MGKGWLVSPQDEACVRGLSSALGISPLLAHLLINRGFGDRDKARRFLQPRLSHLYEPSVLPGLTRAAERISSALANRERIILYGDYDADGISGLALLKQCLAYLGKEVDYYIPHRLDEGYGLNMDALCSFRAQGASLIITVDCGTTASEEAAYARQQGMDLIITDHHECGDTLPECVALVNPKLPNSTYPFRHLSGVGVVFKLAWALGECLSLGKKVSEEFRENLVNWLGLVALGTVADVVPLLGENRVLVKYGLEALRVSSQPGIKALVEVCGFGRSLDARAVAFGLGPRINAAGRLGDASAACELLTTNSAEIARQIARNLDACNRRRQKLERDILDEAEATIGNEGLEHAKAIVLGSQRWHAGVIGIVASRIAERYHRPTVLLALAGEAAQGSARSIPGFDIFEALKACGDMFLSCGGHAQAAGLRLDRSLVDAFRENFLQVAEDTLRDEDLLPKLSIDAEVPLSLLTEEAVEELLRLAPFGQGNPEPLFAARVRVVGRTRRVGDGKHLRFVVRQGDVSFPAIAFGRGEEEAWLQKQENLALAFVPEINIWRSRKSVQLRVIDMVAAEDWEGEASG